MPLRRRKILATLATALVLAPAVAGSEGFPDDVVPGVRHSIPSPEAEEIAPRYRPYRTAQAPAKAPARPSVAADGMAVAPADATEGRSGPAAAPGAANLAKPGVPAAAASPDRAAGEPKSGERLAPDAAESAPAPSVPNDGEIAMVRVPAPIVKAARKALPGIVFKSVDLSRSGTSTVYGLSGTSDYGRAVSVAIDQTAKVLKVDRQARDVEVPQEVMALVEAVLPGARIERATLSLRPGFTAFYTFTGASASDQPFTLDIRSDGRSLAFVDPE